MSIIARWGVEDAQKAFFHRQLKFRRTLDVLTAQKGHAVLSDNSLAFKLRNPIKTAEDMTRICLDRIIRPTMENGDPVIPHIVGINTDKNEFTMYSYAPIYKAFAKKVDGLVDVLMFTLGNKGCNLFAYVSGARGGQYGDLAVVAVYDLRDKSTLRRAFQRRENGKVDEFTLPLQDYMTIFAASFDGDIWTEKAAWNEIVH